MRGVIMAEQPPLSEQEHADLIAFLDGELGGAAARRVEARLSLDPHARAEASALKQTWDLLDHLPRAEPSPAFTQHTLERLTLPDAAAASPVGQRGYRTWALGLGWAAALLLSTLVGFAGFDAVAPREPTEQELVQDLRFIENKRFYDLIDDMEFLHELDHPELFGEEVMGS